MELRRSGVQSHLWLPRESKVSMSYVRHGLKQQNLPENGSPIKQGSVITSQGVQWTFEYENTMSVSA